MWCYPSSFTLAKSHKLTLIMNDCFLRWVQELQKVITDQKTLPTLLSGPDDVKVFSHLSAIHKEFGMIVCPCQLQLCARSLLAFSRRFSLQCSLLISNPLFACSKAKFFSLYYAQEQLCFVFISTTHPSLPRDLAFLNQRRKQHIQLRCFSQKRSHLLRDE